MEFIFDNPFARMYGPYFLMFYGTTIIATAAAIFFFKRSLDKSDRLARPIIPNVVDPFEIAYLRGGENEAARSVVFALVQKELVEIVGSDKNFAIGRTANPAPGGLSVAERTALAWIESCTREPRELFAAGGLTEHLASITETYRRRLEGQSFIFGAATISTLFRFRFFALTLIIGLGVYKLLAAILNSNRSFFLIPVFCIAGVLIVYWTSVLPRLTKLGTEYLERLQIAFSGMKRVASGLPSEPGPDGRTSFAGVDPTILAVGVFGGGFLAGSMYDQYNQAFNRANASAAGGGCGSSCGAGCGSCSSGGDGGSSCGGGCGGCGGGGD